MPYPNSFFDDREGAQQFGALLREMLLALAFLALVVGVGRWGLGFDQPATRYLACDAEALDFKRGLRAYVGQGARFAGGEMQSARLARSGNYAVELTRKHPYGMTYEEKHLRGNAHYRVAVWRHGGEREASRGKLVASVDGCFWQVTGEVVAREDSGWEQIAFEFSPPVECQQQLLKIFCWNEGRTPLYFDDLEIWVRYKEW